MGLVFVCRIAVIFIILEIIVLVVGLVLVLGLKNIICLMGFFLMKIVLLILLILVRGWVLGMRVGCILSWSLLEVKLVLLGVCLAIVNNLIMKFSWVV